MIELFDKWHIAYSLPRSPGPLRVLFGVCGAKGVYLSPIGPSVSTAINRLQRSGTQEFRIPKFQFSSGGDGGRVDFAIFVSHIHHKRVTSFVTDTSVSLLFEILRHLLLLLSL